MVSPIRIDIADTQYALRVKISPGRCLSDLN